MSEHVTVRQLSAATQQVQEWINDLASRSPFENPEQAYSVLRAVLHAVRDRLTADEVAQLGAQLPMILRGIYFEGWRPALAPNDFDTVDEFYERIRASLDGGEAGSLDLRAATDATLRLLTDRVDPGEMRHVGNQLPDAIAALLPGTAEAVRT